MRRKKGSGRPKRKKAVKKETLKMPGRVDAVKFLNLIPHPVCVTDKNSRIIFANREMAARFGGYECRKAGDYFAPFIKHEKEDKEKYASKRTAGRKYRCRAGGKIYEVVKMPFPVKNNKGMRLFIARDITNGEKIKSSIVKKNESLETKIKRVSHLAGSQHESIKSKLKALAKISRLWKKVFSSTNYLVAYLDKKFNFIRVNEAYAESAGKSAEYFTGKNHFDIYPDNENRKIFRKVVMSGESYVAYARPFEYPDNPEKGITYWDWSLQPVKGLDGKTEGLILTLVDVTEREKARAELAAARKKIEEQKRLSDMGRLSATIAHELRNPLGVISTAVYNIRKKANNPAIEKNLRNIEKKVEESGLIINNLLNFTRMKEPEFKEAEFFRMLKDVINVEEEKFSGAGIKVNCEFETNDFLYIKCDPVQMRLVLCNVFDNSFQAVDKNGMIKAGVKVKGQVLKIRITDNGCGIRKKEIKKIFEPFYTTKSKGTGLGLWATREYVKKHHGRFSLKSIYGKGTAIEITLPVNSKNNIPVIEKHQIKDET